MPVEWDRRGRVVVVRTIGNYSNAEVRAAIDQAAADPGFQAGTSLVFDGTRSEASTGFSSIRPHPFLSIEAVRHSARRIYVFDRVAESARFRQ